MYMTEDFQTYVEVWFKLHPREKKYESTDNVTAIVTRMRSYGLAVPSDTMVFRAVSELVSEEQISRTDGGDESTDKLGAAIAERARIDRLASAPLTEADFTKFSRMSPEEVQGLFHNDRVFAARYTRAATLWGFKIPGAPAPLHVDISAENDQSQWSTLDAKTYHSIPTARIVRLYQSDAGFKRAVDRLIKSGQI